jgi:hypothetical protein
MHDTLLMVFTGILAVAVLMQTIIFFLMYRSIQRLTTWMDSMGKDLLRNMEVISAKVDEGLTAVKGLVANLKPVTEKLAEATEIVHDRVVEIDHFLAETTSAARLEILRIQDTMHDASRRIKEMLDMLHTSIQNPLSQINAISHAVRVAVDVLFRRRRGLGVSAQDEEMFI